MESGTFPGRRFTVSCLAECAGRLLPRTLPERTLGCIVIATRSVSPAPPSGGGQRIGAAHRKEEIEMAVSDQLTTLAARAKEAEEHAAAAQSKAKADLEADVKDARASAQAQADRLHESADANRARISAWWHDVQRSWSQHVAAVKEDMADRRAEHDVDRANKRAENAEGDAAFAIDYAVAAIEEAEYAVLNASLARMEADELAGASA
jgi:hypothetical protein